VVVATALKAMLPFVTRPKASYYLQCRASNKVLEVANGSHDDVDLKLASWTGGANQRFRFDPAGDDCYFIVPQGTPTKVLDVNDASTDQGARVCQYIRKNGDNQKWQVLVGKDGWYYLVARHSGQALDVGGGGTTDGNPIQQWGVCPAGGKHTVGSLSAIQKWSGSANQNGSRSARGSGWAANQNGPASA
jgi:hypothetical protein